MADREDPESGGTPGAKALVAWEDLQDTANLAFSIWVHQPELRWAKQAWGILEGAGLTFCATERERYQVLVRFIALADLYHEFCHLAWEEMYEPALREWAEVLRLSPFRIGQLAGLAGVDEWPDDDGTADDDEAVTAALMGLVHRARDEIIPVLQVGFGGVDGLFVALWRSNRFEPPPSSDTAHAQPEARGEGADGQAEGDHEDDVTIDLFNGLLDEPEPETDKEILNDITSEKLPAYDWLTAGCPP